MTNLQEIINRYKDKLASYESSVTGMLSWGCHQYYEISSDIPCSLNSSCGEKYNKSDKFIINRKKQVQLWEFREDEGTPYSHYKYYTDETQTKEITSAEADKLDDYYFVDTYQPKTWWGKKLDEYYPHPWYPDKKIKSFEVIRILPMFKLGQIYIPNDRNNNFYTTQTCLEYPEFFRPNYE